MGLRSKLVVGIAAALTLVAASGVKGQLVDDRDRDYNDRFTAYIGSNTYQFSPSLNGELGRVKLYTILSHPDAAQDRDLGRAFWVVEIRSGDGSLVRRAIGKVDLDDVGQAYGEFTWNGRDGNGHLVSAGTYQYTFRSRFLPGRLLAAVSPDEYERVEVERAADEAYSSTGEVVVNYDLSLEDSLALRASRAAGACAQQQNTPLEASFGYNFYYGGLHSHSNYSDGGFNPSSCSGSNGAGAYSPAMAYDYARNQAGLDFWAVTEHNHLMDDALKYQTGSLTETTIKQRYQAGLSAANTASVDGAFVALFGVEFGVLTNGDQGHVIYLESPKFINWETCSTCGSTSECTPGTNCYFDVYAPKRYGYLQFYQRSAENPSSAGALGLLAHPGSSEFDNYAFNTYADQAMQGIAVRSGTAFSTATTCADANAGTSDYFSKWTKALSIGFHVGPVGDSDAHCANYGVAVPTRTVYLLPNSSTPVLTKARLLTAHKARHFFATEDPNIQLVFASADGHIMGDIYWGGSQTFRVAVYDPDGESTSTIEIWRGQPGGSAPTAAYASTTNASTYSITESLSSGTYYYFAHIRQADGHDAWSAPMWVTYSGATTYAISGTVTLSGSGLAGVTVSTGSASATTSSTGAYTISGLANGTYTVTPSRSGYTFTPTNQSVTVSGANVTGKNFTATSTATYSISGTITLSGSGLAGVTVSTGSASATTSSTGAYTISGLANGTYTVTPSRSGYTFTPASQSVTVSGANVTGKSFTAAVVGGSTTLFSDGFEGTGWSTAQVSGTAGAWTTVTSGTYPTVSPHGGSKLEKFNSYNASSGSQTRLYRATGFAIASSYTSASLTFWMYHDTGYSSNNDRVQPQISTNGSTWTNVGSAVARYATTTGWTQHTVDVSGYRGQSAVQVAFLGISAYGNNIYLDDIAVTASGTAPATYSVSGTITLSGSGLSGVTVSSGSATATTSSSGAYTISGLVSGTYTVTPTRAGYTFAPASQSVTVSGANVTGKNFTATPAASCGAKVVISQVYGGGGLTGAYYANDFIEIFNRGDQTQSLSGWSVQYASASGTSWSVTALSGSIPAGGYYLVKMASSGSGTSLPTANATGTTNLSSTSGKVAVVASTTALSGSCPTSSTIKDLIGFGSASCKEGSTTAPTLSATTSARRAGAGCTDTNVNGSDFAATSSNASNPARNSSTALNLCTCQ